MKILYQLGQFISHARAGRENMLALEASGHELVSDPGLADVAVIHDEPIFFSNYLNKLSNLPVVAYSVVETNPMPPVYLEPLGSVNEIWTCSKFSRDILAHELGNVHVVPHVVSRPRFTAVDLGRIHDLLDVGPDEFIFYTICDGVNRRKNLAALLRAFATLGGNVKLVVKQYRHCLDLSNLPGVISISEELSAGEISALHVTGHCYVSAHCAEAWGLGLSEAMAFGRPVVATGYSGNMEFMNADNSLPVDYSLEPIRAEDLEFSPPFFTPDMHWAYVNEVDLANKMGRVMRQKLNHNSDFARSAAQVSQTFSHANVGQVMSERLRVLVAGA